MKRSLALVCLFAFALASALPALAQNSPDVEKAIADLEQKWAEAQKDGKPDVVDPLLADRFVNTDTDAKVSGKKDLLANLKGGKWEHNAISDVKVTVFGHVAIATGAWAGKGVDGDGTKVDRHERWTDTWVRMRGGLWQCVRASKPNSSNNRRCPRFARLTWAYPDPLLQPRIPRHRMTRLIRVRHQLLVHRLRHIGLPIPGGLRESHNLRTNITATPAANTHVGIFRGAGINRGNAICSAPSAGHTATHSKHPVHSADLIVSSLSTGNDADGQAFAHFAQSMHADSFRRMRNGLNTDDNPSSAPYGHKYRHQKFCTNTDATASTPSTINPVVPMNRKKFSIFTSATIPYGLCMNPAIAVADMLDTAHTKNPSSRYFNPRSGISTHRGK